MIIKSEVMLLDAQHFIRHGTLCSAIFWDYCISLSSTNDFCYIFGM